MMALECTVIRCREFGLQGWSKCQVRSGRRGLRASRVAVTRLKASLTDMQHRTLALAALCGIVKLVADQSPVRSARVESGRCQRSFALTLALLALALALAFLALPLALPRLPFGSPSGRRRRATAIDGQDPRMGVVGVTLAQSEGRDQVQIAELCVPTRCLDALAEGLAIAENQIVRLLPDLEFIVENDLPFRTQMRSGAA